MGRCCPLFKKWMFGTLKCVLYWEVYPLSFIYWRFYCVSLSFPVWTRVGPWVCPCSAFWQSLAGGTQVSDPEPAAPLAPSPSAAGTCAADCTGVYIAGDLYPGTNTSISTSTRTNTTTKHPATQRQPTFWAEPTDAVVCRWPGSNLNHNNKEKKMPECLWPTDWGGIFGL